MALCAETITSKSGGEGRRGVGRTVSRPCPNEARYLVDGKPVCGVHVRWYKRYRPELVTEIQPKAV